MRRLPATPLFTAVFKLLAHADSNHSHARTTTVLSCLVPIQKFWSETSPYLLLCTCTEYEEKMAKMTLPASGTTQTVSVLGSDQCVNTGSLNLVARSQSAI